MAGMNLKQFKKELEDFSKDLKGNIKNNYIDSLAKSVTQDLKKIARTSVDLWYESYDPIYYTRTNSLYKAYKVEQTSKNTITFFMGSEYMPKTHRVDSTGATRNGESYIYQTMFVEGWHGGADYISDLKIDEWGNHPMVGTPWYRTQHPSQITSDEIPWKEWSNYGANWSKSPRDMIMSEIDNYETNGSYILGGASVANRKDEALMKALSKNKFYNKYIR